jgi:hypothetical protein
MPNSQPNVLAAMSEATTRTTAPTAMDVVRRARTFSLRGMSCCIRTPSRGRFATVRKGAGEIVCPGSEPGLTVGRYCKFRV